MGAPTYCRVVIRAMFEASTRGVSSLRAKAHTTIRGLLVALASIGVAFPQPLVGAAEPAGGDFHGAMPAAEIADVSLAAGGVLTGYLLDAAGRPASGVVVTVAGSSGSVQAATTDVRGTFTVAGLKGGAYRVVAGESNWAVRLWAAGTSPPSADGVLRLVSGPATVRGQREPGPPLSWYEGMKYWLTNPYVVGGIVAAAVAIPVVIHNANQDRDSGS